MRSVAAVVLLTSVPALGRKLGSGSSGNHQYSSTTTYTTYSTNTGGGTVSHDQLYDKVEEIQKSLPTKERHDSLVRQGRTLTLTPQAQEILRLRKEAYNSDFTYSDQQLNEWGINRDFTVKGSTGGSHGSSSGSFTGGSSEQWNSNLGPANPTHPVVDPVKPSMPVIPVVSGKSWQHGQAPTMNRRSMVNVWDSKKGGYVKKGQWEYKMAGWSKSAQRNGVPADYWYRNEKFDASAVDVEIQNSTDPKVIKQRVIAYLAKDKGSVTDTLFHDKGSATSVHIPDGYAVKIPLTPAEINKYEDKTSTKFNFTPMKTDLLFNEKDWKIDTSKKGLRELTAAEENQQASEQYKQWKQSGFKQYPWHIENVADENGYQQYSSKVVSENAEPIKRMGTETRSKFVELSNKFNVGNGFGGF